MVRDPFRDDAEPQLEPVLSALIDEDSRTIICHLDSPLTASELSEAADIPLSTTYRKLDRMVEATLLEELTEIRPGGRHTTRYRVDFEDVLISKEEECNFDISVSRPARTADERLAYLWTEVKKGV